MSTVYKEVEVEIDLDVNDVIDFLNSCSKKEYGKIESYIGSVNNTKLSIHSIADEYRYELCEKLFKTNLSDSELENILKTRGGM